MYFRNQAVKCPLYFVSCPSKVAHTWKAVNFNSDSIVFADGDSEYACFGESSSEKVKRCYQGKNVLDFVRNNVNGHHTEPTPQIVFQ
jgi:hypothetical protein